MDTIKALGRNTFSSLGIRNYRLYFFGQCISMSGTWMQTVALGWLVLSITHSGSQLGLVTAMQFLPVLFFGPYGGVIADRLDKRSIMYWTQSFAGIIAAILSALVFTGATQVWMLYIFALALGIIRVFENPARQALVYEMVGGDQIKNAVSLNATANNLARAIGPSIGGILIAGVGIAFCFLFNAFSYIAVIFTLYRMHVQDLHIATLDPAKEKGSGNIREGLRYIADNPAIRDILLMMAVIGTFAYEFQVTLPILAQQTFHGNASDYAALMAAFGAGSAIGGIFSASRKIITPRQFVIATFLFGASMLATAGAPTIHVAIFGMIIVGIFSINVISLGNTTIQLATSPEMRGRVLSFWSMAMIGSTPIGGPIVGWIGEHVGARWGIAVGGIATLLTACFALAILRRTTKALPPIAISDSSDPVIEKVKV